MFPRVVDGPQAYEEKHDTHAPHGEKTTTAKYGEALKIAAAVPRSAVGNQAATMRLLPGNAGASATPTRSLKPNRAMITVLPAKNPTVPCRKVKSDHSR